ncbi:Multidrug resistance protein MexB [Zhongshania aliphaticivorans]|uniref:Multidrug resistance protein MexB n=1 Tax=Zhongshania aliphaticivorans TaxID=1470434 RepID=A0A5S9MY74_9GAMM|nr:efflux RND transporter permease subunit [Zhongshania aliphaticivorans]CAA0080539.1 Multidrug resistance protein MexB [Zhongshania aliphaticivorans]CAA0085599.1 Multidrug resistance protein MexB [Zhongshania aliphaticivorans]
MSNGGPLRGIISWFASNPVAANLLLLLVIVLGIMEVGSIRKEAFPSIEPDRITVSIVYDSGSADQAEEGLTIKIEDALEDIIGVKTITSTSTANGVSVVVEKKSGYDLDTLLRDTKSAVDAISNLPDKAEQPVIEKAEREEHALWLQLYGETSRHNLQQLAERLKTDLLANANVSKVSISGTLDPMMSIEIDEGRLQAYGISLSDVETAVNNGSTTTRTPVLNAENIYLQLKTAEQAYEKSEFADIPLLTTSSGTEIRLGDVATIQDTFDDEGSVLSRFAGKDSIALQVITTGNDDISNTVKGAQQVVDKWIADGRLPESVELASWYDRSESIMDRLNLLVENALLGVVLVFIMLALFLNLSVAIWVALGLPFIYFGTLYLMGDSVMGMSLNEFTTFGLIMALGIVVDDAVVIGESIYTQREKYGDTIDNTIQGTLNVALPTLFGVLTTVAAFYSLSKVSGNLGQIYSQFAVVVGICLMLSAVESKLILPSHLAHINTRSKTAKNKITRAWQQLQNTIDAGVQWFTENVYRKVIDGALRQRYAVLVLFLAIFVGVVSMPFTGAVKMSFFPAISGDTTQATLTMQADASFGITHRNLRTLEKTAYEADAQLRNNQGESSITNLQLLSSGIQSGGVTVELGDDTPYSMDAFTNRWRQLTGELEGALSLTIRSHRHMTDALRIELRSSDDDVLAAAGESLKEKLQAIPAVSGIEDNLTPGQPQVQLKLNDQGRALGLTTEDLASQVLQAFEGQVVQRFQRSTDEVEVKVRYPEADRGNPSNLLAAKVRTDDGSVVPLSSIATIDYGFTRQSINRIDSMRAVYISSDVDKDMLSSTELVAQLKDQIIPPLLKQYPGLDVHFAGEAEEQAETQTSMAKVSVMAMLIIFMLLAIPLQSYIQPIIIMTAIPFGIVGAILGHWFNDLSLGILSFNGIIALSGVVVNDSLLLVSRFNELKKESDNIHDAISEACRSRLRAVFLTSVTTYVGLAPLLGETSTQAQFLIPAAVSLAYGILFATVITLIIIPALLYVQNDVSNLLTRGKNYLFANNATSIKP